MAKGELSTVGQGNDGIEEQTGAAAMIAGYLGTRDFFGCASARFLKAYADQPERDHAAFIARHPEWTHRGANGALMRRLRLGTTGRPCLK
jgi:hypothetical protein